MDSRISCGYTYSHALGISPDNWSFLQPINSNDVRGLYGSSPFDIRHHFTFSATYAIPGIKTPGQILEGWSLNTIVNLQSALPWGVNDLTTDFSGTGEINSIPQNGEQWDFYGNPNDFTTTKAFINTNGGAGGIPYYPGTSNPTCLSHAQANGSIGRRIAHRPGLLCLQRFGFDSSRLWHLREHGPQHVPRLPLL